MEMIERYIYSVTQKLPHSQRKDIADELQGLIEDMLEERGAHLDNKNAVEEVLMELGNPRLLADKYRGATKYLIGPEIFDAYMQVLKIVLITVSAMIGVGFVIQTVLNPVSILDYFIDMIISLVTGLPMAFGWTTFGFALGEYYGGGKQINVLGKEWTPADLPPIPDEKRQIKRSEPIIGIIFYVVVMVFLAFSHEYFGVWIFHDEFSGVVPFLNEETYRTYFPFILLILGFGILKECIKLISGKWTYKLAMYTTMLNIISVAAMILLINGPAFWNPNFIPQLVEAGVISTGGDAFNVITTIWDQLTFWILILLIIGLIWDIADAFIRARKK